MNSVYIKVLNVLFVSIFVFVFTSNFAVKNKAQIENHLKLKNADILQKSKYKFQQRFRGKRERVKSYCDNPPSEEMAIRLK